MKIKRSAYIKCSSCEAKVNAKLAKSNLCPTCHQAMKGLKSVRVKP